MTDYGLALAPAARRAIESGLPEDIATAVIEFITGPLVENPRRVGKELVRDLAGLHSARRGTYRVIYRIDDAAHEVVVLRIDHRRAVYR